MTALRSSLLLLAVLALPGCTMLGSAACLTHCGDERTASTSVTAWLYPENGPLPEAAVTPTLRLPLRVGLVSLPSRYGRGIDPAGKLSTLDRVRERFANEDFIAEIVVIPEHYLDSADSFGQLNQLRRLYGVDVIALLAYDQVVHNEENELALGYLTVVGALFLAGSEHDVSTLVDLAVVDVETRRLLLRAGGTSRTTGRTTAARKIQTVRQDRTTDFDAASDAMMENLALELDRFRRDVREGTARVRVEGGGSGGGGSLGPLALALLAGLWLPRLSARRRLRAS